MDTNDLGYNVISEDEIVYSLVEERKMKLMMINGYEPSHSEAFDAFFLFGVLMV